MATMVCPECGEELKPGQRTCPNCDYQLSEAELQQAQPQPEQAKPEPAAPAATPTARPQGQQPTGVDTVMAHGSVDMSQNNSRQTVLNGNITINLGAGGQLPHGLVDDATTDLINAASAQQAQQAQRPVAQKPQAQPVQPAQQVPESGQKGVGALNGSAGQTVVVEKGSSNGKWIAIGLVAVAVIVGIFLFGGKEEAPKQVASEQVTEAPTSTKTTAKSAGSKAAKATSEEVTAAKATHQVATAAPTAPVAPKYDEAYTRGKAAYEAGDGIEAVKWLKQSRNKEANALLAAIYENGCGGVSANPMMAQKYRKQAQ